MRRVGEQSRSSLRAATFFSAIQCTMAECRNTEEKNRYEELQGRPMVGEAGQTKDRVSAKNMHTATPKQSCGEQNGNDVGRRLLARIVSPFVAGRKYCYHYGSFGYRGKGQT